MRTISSPTPGPAARTMAILRNLALAILQLIGHRQIIRTLQCIARDRTRILPILAASRYQPGPDYSAITVYRYRGR